MMQNPSIIQRRTPRMPTTHPNPTNAFTNDTNDTTTNPPLPTPHLPILPFPPHILSILSTEAMERFSYYGMRCLLVLYLSSSPPSGGIGLSESAAISLYSYTIAAAYISPLLGAICADSSIVGWGRYTTILRFGIVYVVGMVVVSAAAAGVGAGLAWTVVGLVGVCVGTGGIKPCVSAFGADQLGYLTSNGNDDDNDGEKDLLLRKFFSTFYVSINIGSLAAFLILPLIRVWRGFAFAFSVCALALALSIWLFWANRGSYVGRGRTTGRDVVGITLRILWKAMVVRFWWWWDGRRGGRRGGGCGGDGVVVMACDGGGGGGGGSLGWVDAALELEIEGNSRSADYERTIPALSAEELDGLNGGVSPTQIPYTKEDVKNAKDALKTLPVMACLPMFWMLFDQQGSTWTLQAKDMNLHGIEPEQVGVLNPLLVMILIPIFEQKIYPSLEGCGCHLSHLTRMKWGMLLSAIAFSISGFLETAVEKGSRLAAAAATEEYNGAAAADGDANNGDFDAFRVSVLWQFPQIAIITTAEILVSVTGLEFSYANSPDSMKALIMTMFFLTVAVGNVFSGILYSVLADLNRAVILHLCSFLMLVTMGVFQKIQWYWEVQQHQSGGGSETSFHFG